MGQILAADVYKRQLQGAERGAFVKLISVRVFEALGLDTAPLTQAREAYKKKQDVYKRQLLK